MKDVNKRVTAEQALQHKWLTMLDTDGHSRHKLDRGIVDSIAHFSKYASFKRAALFAMAFAMDQQVRGKRKDMK